MTTGRTKAFQKGIFMGGCDGSAQKLEGFISLRYGKGIYWSRDRIGRKDYVFRHYLRSVEA